jgi:hypothetical protein
MSSASVTALLLCWATSAASAAPGTAEIAAIPTFECMSLEWPCPDGSPRIVCRAEYRREGDAAWRHGHDLWFDPAEKQYRGSVVSLMPGTTYEFRLTLPDGRTASVHRATRSERFPVSSRVVLPAGTLRETLTITQGGDATGFRLYEAHPDGTVIDVAAKADYGVRIDADRVILRGVTCRGARVHGVSVGNRKDVVIEECDISGWGRPEPKKDPRKRPDLGAHLDSGIFCEGADLERVVIQGCRIHHPRYTSNDWSEWSPFFNSNHPQGPKAIVFKPHSRGGHVIRFNDVYSDDRHLFNDLLFESDPGWPGNGITRDTDVYGNRLSDCTDDAIEIERGTRNVRVWGNYFDNAGIKTLSVRPCWEGPYYVFRNVVNRSYVPKGKSNYNGNDIPVGMFLVGGGRGKQGAPSELKERGVGFIYHNTLLCPPGAGFERFLVGDFPQGLKDAELWFQSRNNIATTRPVRPVAHCPVNDFFTAKVVTDYDLLNGPVDRPAAAGPNTVRGAPLWRTGHGVGDSGSYQLAEGSPGRAAGTPVPNFSDGFAGKAPDIGAHENGAPPMLFGVRAWKARQAAGKAASGNGDRK